VLTTERFVETVNDSVLSNRKSASSICDIFQLPQQPRRLRKKPNTSKFLYAKGYGTLLKWSRL